MSDLIVHWKNARIELSSEWISAGVCRVNHNIGHRDYGVQLTLNEAGFISLGSTYNTYFIVKTATTANVLSNLNFDFTVTGDNKEG